MKVFLIFWIFGFGSCVSVPTVPPREKPIPTRFSIEVENQGLLGISLQKKTEAMLRDELIRTRMGIPVAQSTDAQLTIIVEITDTNFTEATEYHWQLVDRSNQTILASKTHSFAAGADAQMIASTILRGISHLDLAAYASEGDNDAIPKVASTSNSVFPSSKTPGENDYAVVIGIEAYRDDIPEALYAANDARSFGTLLEQTFNLPEKNIKIFVNDRAAKTDILGAIFEWLPRNAQDPNGRVFVFFSGHGSPKIDSGDAYILPYDANPTYLKTSGISIAEVQKELEKLKTKEVYLILDSCFSGQGRRSVIAKGTRPLVPVKPFDKTEVIMLAASRESETTGIHQASENGVFTHYLIEGLQGASDSDNDRSIDLSELFSFVSEAVEKSARQQNREQHPIFMLPFDTKASEFVLVKELETK